MSAAYEVLGISESATDEEVKKAHKNLSTLKPTEYEQMKGVKTYVEIAEDELQLKIKEEDILSYNSILLPNDIVEDEDPHYCDEIFEYNVDKYIDMFNKRVTPLLVCFSTEIRYKINEKGKIVNNILITNPKDRKCFTEDESVLVNSQPYNDIDQDTYEQLMTIEDKEMKFWLKVNKKPPYVDECGMDWEKIKNSYINSFNIEDKEIEKERALYDNIIQNLTQTEIDDYIDNNIIPSQLSNIIYQNKDDIYFMSKKYNIKLGSIYDILENNTLEISDV